MGVAANLSNQTTNVGASVEEQGDAVKVEQMPTTQLTIQRLLY